MLRGQSALLLAIEVLCLLAFVAAAGVAVTSGSDSGELVPIDADALTVGPSRERWYGLFFQGHHVGYSVSRTSPTEDGVLYEQRGSFRFAAAGQLQEVLTAGAATTGADGRLRRFDFFMAADPVRISVEGEVQGDEIVMDIEQAGETSVLRFPVSRPPQVGLSFQQEVADRELAIGDRFTVPYFDPVTLAEGEMEVLVSGVEVVAGHEEAFWLEREFSGVTTRMLVTHGGEVLREESAMGMQSVRMSRQEAQAIPQNDEPVDLIAQSAVSVKGRIDAPRSVTKLTVTLQGKAADRVPEFAPWQTRSGDVLTVTAPQDALVAGTPVKANSEDPAVAPWLEHTPTISAAHPEIVAQAAEVVGDATDRLTAVTRLAAYVDRYVEDVPVMGVPNGLDVLRRGQGDCNEHTALFVSLARAAQVPARIAAGVVYSDRVAGTGGKGAFYYHAWPEVRLSPDGPWIPLDPTFGQVPADATHIKLVEGDLDRQIEIMAYMGRLGFEVVDVAHPETGADPAPRPQGLP